MTSPKALARTAGLLYLALIALGGSSRAYDGHPDPSGSPGRASSTRRLHQGARWRTDNERVAHAVEGWARMLGADPLPWLLASDEPSARWLALTGLLDRSPYDADVRDAHAAVIADAGTRELVGRLRDWETPAVLSGHDSPGFGPNLLCLLARIGVRQGDHAAIDWSIEAMLRHQDEDGRLAACAVSRANPDGAWGSLLCDAHAIAEVLVRFGRADEPAVRAAMARIEADVARTADGPAWPCIPSLGFRGPGRKGEPCPQVSVEALRTLALLPPARRPSVAVDVARTLLELWRRRGDTKPYMFGHGVTFKTVKWPPFWYSVLAVLDALGGYPELWRGRDARPEDRRSVAELAACLVAYNVDADGRVTPQSCFRGFDGFSFGQKKLPSPFATALVATVLRRFDDLADEVAAVDVLALGSSKGGSGTARPPKRPFASSRD